MRNWDDGVTEIDTFAYEAGEYHNGPVCEVCGFGFCHHCCSEGYNTECGVDNSEFEGSNDSNLDAGMLGLEQSIRARFKEPKEKANG